jgi:hypothetical protein
MEHGMYLLHRRRGKAAIQLLYVEILNVGRR